MRRLARETDEVLAGFIRGQGLVCLFLALFYALGLWLVGLRYGLIIGLLTGFFSFIPYIGMAIGACVGLTVAAFQFQDLIGVGLVAAVFALGQFIEGNLISPRVVGGRIHLHPVWMIFAVLAGTVLFGFLGTLLAVPVAGVLGVLVRFGIKQYQTSALYRVSSSAGPRTVSEQLRLDFEHAPATGAEDFMPGESNREALAWLARWPAWPYPALILHGPPGSGKSHLARIWAARTGARSLDHAAIASADPNAQRTWVLDDAEPVPDEQGLLSFYNRLREGGGYLLLTARRPVGAWMLRLPDLASRLRAAPVVAIGPPDDALLGAVLLKLFADRQLVVSEASIEYLVRHMERSFGAAQTVVAGLDSMSLRLQRPITVALARSLLECIEPAQS